MNLQNPNAIHLVSLYELGHTPYGLSSPAGFLRQAGYAPTLHDLSTCRLSDDHIREALFIGISVPMHTALRLGLELGHRIKAVNPKAHLCYYGLYAGLNQQMLLEHVAHSTIGGEFEPALLAHIQHLDGKGPPAEDISLPGQLKPPRISRTAFTLPERADLPDLAQYANLVHKGQTVTAGYTQSSRGCKHQCMHCPLPAAYNGKFFVVSQHTVLMDIQKQVEEGARHITFGDPDFLNGPGHALKVIQGLHQAFPDITYDITTKVEHIIKHPHLLPVLRDSGCLFIISAVESLSDKVLTILNKGHSSQQVKTAILLTKTHGIALRPTFLPFTPWSTMQDYRALLEFVLREGLANHVDPIQLTIRLLVPPGSLLENAPDFAAHKGNLDEKALSYNWSHPDPNMDTLQQKALRLVETGLAEGLSAEQILQSLLMATLDLMNSGINTHDEDLPISSHHPPAPRMSESWFC